MKQSRAARLFSHVGLVDKLLFTKHLAVMLKSGITLAESLSTLTEQTKSSALKEVILSLQKDIRNGQTLADALKKHTKVFDLFYISLIDIGEQSGTLEENLAYLAEHLGKSYALRKKVQGALLYPAIVLSALGVIGLALTFFVLPRLVDLFKSLNADLPLSTKMLLFVAEHVKNEGHIILPVFIVVCILLRLLLIQPRMKPYTHAVYIRLPVLGPFLQNSQMASICRDLGVMLKSGLSIRAALDIQYKNTTNYVFQEYIGRLQRSVNKGQSIADELSAKHFTLIPPIATRMIAVGEKTGKLDEIFLYLADFFEEEVDDEAKNLSVVLEPIILLIVGLAVAFVALSIISPIYQLTGSIEQ